jgi:hypothetical protein
MRPETFCRRVIADLMARSASSQGLTNIQRVEQVSLLSSLAQRDLTPEKFEQELQRLSRPAVALARGGLVGAAGAILERWHAAQQRSLMPDGQDC